jgi:uncharacterized protein (DUF885 family)
MKTKMLRKISLALTLLLAAGLALAAHTWFAKPLSIDWFYLRYLVQQGLKNPEQLTSLRMLESYGLRGHNAKLSDDSLAQDEQDYARLKADYATLTSYNTKNFSRQEKVSFDVFRFQMETELEDSRWRNQNYVVTQLFGVHSWLPQLMSDQQQIHDATDAEHYIARMQAIPTKMAQLAEKIAYRAQQGTIPPRFALDKAIAQIDRFTSDAPQANPLVKTFQERLAKIPADKMPATQRDEWVKRAEAAIVSHVLPAYGTLRKALDAQRATQTSNNGVWALKDGAAFYESRIFQHTTTRMKADDLHTLGLSEVARIGNEIDALLTKLNLPGETRAAKIKALELSATEQYPNNDEGRAQVLKDYQKIVDEVEAGLDPQFKTKPKAKMVVKRVPAYAEKGAPAAYYNAPAFDGSAPGVFYANLGNLAETSKFRMRTLSFHEGIPGHHMQIAIAQELQGLPIFRSLFGFTAYAEGWALYAERLAWEMGFIKTPGDDLGRLTDEMLRAVRLVVDTGIHAKKWTREQAIQYMAKELGTEEEAAVTEIERYFVDPGQALAYKVGMLKILELREKARTALGAKFDPRAFHDVVLTNGSVPLTVLEGLVEDYIASAKTSAS